MVPAGKTLPQHQVPGEITLLCIEGECELKTPGTMQVLTTGDFVHLEGGTPHALTGRSVTPRCCSPSACAHSASERVVPAPALTLAALRVLQAGEGRCTIVAHRPHARLFGGAAFVPTS